MASSSTMKRGMLFGVATLVMGARVLAADDLGNRHFLEKVKPLLESRCLSCHGPEKQKGGLRLDSRAAVMKGGDNGPVLALAKPAQSSLLQAVMHAKPEISMPPKE